jgi:mediator of RNA polymerase II transcription subunit 14
MYVRGLELNSFYFLLTLLQLGYVEEPPLSAKELLKSMKDLNTLLSMRLNLHEYEKIPLQFKDYSIKSGRVTFRVAGEFEVDLTIADEDPEKQFWFIDFRFLFSPSTSQLSENLRYVIENRVNAVLEKDGLTGCYKFLHELVLTHKISEFRSQAFDLSRGRWINMLRVEPLHRALSVQYWVDRYGKDGPKSWIILGVHSGKRKDGKFDPKATSRISVRWFRDSEEVKDHNIPLELTNISMEALLQTVISRHILHILESTHNNISAKPLYSNRELSVSLKTSGIEPVESVLEVQLTRHESISVTIDAITGRFAISPASGLASQAEWKLNSQTSQPAINAHEFIGNLRCVVVSAEIVSRALRAGWLTMKNPGLKPDDLKPIVPRDTLQISWFRWAGWTQEWIVALSSGMSGERWWLLEM